MHSVNHNGTWVTRLTEESFLTVQHDALANPQNYHAGIKKEQISDPGNEIRFWTASESLEQALNWYKTCWPYGMKLSRKIAPKIRPELKNLAEHLAEVNKEIPTTAGRRLNLPAAIADTSPEHFYKETTTNSAAAGSKKLVNIYVSISTPWSSDTTNIARFGLTLVEVISLLETYNLARFQITLVEACERYSDEQKSISFLKVKNYHQTVSKNRLLVYLAAPFTLRRFYLNIADRIPELVAYKNAYGCPIRDDKQLQDLIKPFTPAREPINVLYSLANVTSGPVLQQILTPLCKTLNLQHWLSSKHLAF